MVMGNTDTPVPALAYKSYKLACDIRIPPAMFCIYGVGCTLEPFLHNLIYMYDDFFDHMFTNEQIPSFCKLCHSYAVSTITRIFRENIFYLMSHPCYSILSFCHVKKTTISDNKGPSSSKLELPVCFTDWISSLLSILNRWSKTSEPSSQSID